MSQVTPIASALGVDFEDVGAALATLTAQGVSTNVAATNMKALFNELSKEGSAASDTFQQIAGKSFPQFIAEGNNVNDALGLMYDHAQDSGLSINNLFGSLQAGQAALLLTGESAKMFAGNIEHMHDAAGATQQAYETMDQGIGRSIEKIKNSMGIMMLELGESLAPAVATFADYILAVMPIIGAVVSGVFAGIGAVIQVFVDIINFVVGLIGESVSESEGEFNSLFESVSETFTAIGNLIAGVLEILTAIWDKYGDDIMSITSTVFGFIGDVISTALAIIKGIFDFFAGLFTADWDKMGQALSTITSAIWGLISSIFSTAVNLIYDILKLAITIIYDLGKGIMTGLWNAFKGVWNSVIGWFSTIFSNLFTWFEGRYSKFKSIGRNMFNNLWSGLKEIWKDIKKWVSDKVKWITDKLAFWRKSNDEMSSGGGGSGTPRYQTGTPYVPTTGLALLHKGEAVIPAKFNPFVGNMALAGTNQTITVNPSITLNVKDVVDLKRQGKEITEFVLRSVYRAQQRMAKG